MLTFLSIRNLALVDQLLWEPQDGFISITGETGAGKSVLISAIALALGERADKSLIRSGEQMCTVEAVFTLSADSVIHNMLESHGVPPCEDGILMIRRNISSTVNRQFINDSPCTLNLLRDIGSHLVDMHGPNDHRSLVSRDRQLALLDAYGEHHELLRVYNAAWRDWQQAVDAYDELSRVEAASEREIELLKHQVDEIDTSGFTIDEVAQLEERWQRARNSTRLLDTASRMLTLIEQGDSSSLLDKLRELSRSSQEMARLDPAAAEPWVSVTTALEIELGELSDNLHDYVRRMDCDPAALAQLEERINQLESLKRKYGPQIEDIIDRHHEAVARLDQIENKGARLAQLQAQAEQARERLGHAAVRLTKARLSAAPVMAGEIARHSRELGFAQSSFEISVAGLGSPISTGCDEVEFLFGPNPGEPLKPLRQIASSGELSRIMLAIKSSLADKDSTPLLVFDEIDSNVGGEVARSVGRKMQELGARHQVISITHFPQVASMAAHHYLVEKAVIRDRTISRLKEVAGDERLDELVRMLGGGGEEARAHAATLLL